MADVFISYKSERVGAVAHLASIIEAHGFSVWFDVRGLNPGPSFGPQIEAALREAKVALVLWLIGTQVTDWDPVNHVEDVFVRPKNWNSVAGL